MPWSVIDALEDPRDQLHFFLTFINEAAKLQAPIIERHTLYKRFYLVESLLSNYYIGGSTESPPSNYYIGGSTCIMTSMYRVGICSV